MNAASTVLLSVALFQDAEKFAIARANGIETRAHTCGDKWEIYGRAARVSLNSRKYWEFNQPVINTRI